MTEETKAKRISTIDSFKELQQGANTWDLIYKIKGVIYHMIYIGSFKDIKIEAKNVSEKHDTEVVILEHKILDVIEAKPEVIFSSSRED